MWNPFSSFRSQMIAFLTITLVVTAVVLSLVNQRLEERTTSQVDEYIQAITLANDAVFESLAKGQYLAEVLKDPARRQLDVSNQSIIRHILILEEDGTVYDSTEKNEIGARIASQTHDLPPLLRGDLKLNERTGKSEGLRSMATTIDTEKARRTIIVVISMDRLQRIKDEAARARLLSLAGIGAVLVLLIAWFSRRATRPISSLAEAARRVASGDLDFETELNPSGEIGALGRTFNEMLADLRRKRELEEQLKRAEHSAVVGRLASGIAHEIRNPLNFINLSIDHLRERLSVTAGESRESRAEFARILGMIKDEIGRLNRMVSNFLSYGRPARFKLRELDASTLIGEIADLVRAQATEQHVALEVYVEGDGSTTFEGDAEQLKTCFSNLVINAIQAMPDGGRMTITLRPGEHEQVIEFSDTGSGIAEDDIQQIFEPYYSTKETGIGLGLPLTRKIIEEHGGRIEVTSELGVGSTFKVTLPREPQAAAVSTYTNEVAERG